MARFEVRLDVAAPAVDVWSRLVDWPAHGRWVPLTRVRVLTGAAGGVGARFVGRTGVGPVGFDDPMEVVGWQPPEGDRPGRCEVVKQGRVLLGGAAFEVLPTPSGCQVVWTEQVELAPARLTRPLGPLLALAGRAGFGRALRAMAAEAEAARRPAPGPAGGAG